MNSGRIDISFGVNAAYAPHIAAVIAALVDHAPGAHFRFIILHDGMPQHLRARVEAVAPAAAFVWEELSDADLPAFVDHGHFNRTTLFRLGLESRAPADCRRVLYLDADIIVLDDIRALWSFDLEGAPIGACYDGYVTGERFAEAWSLPAGPQYFNAGVLLIDLDQIRAEHLFAKALDFYARHAGQLEFNDQDSLNHVFWGRWTCFPVRWNAQRDMAIPAIAAELPAFKRLDGAYPAIIHYTGPAKPWRVDLYHPWSWPYWPNAWRAGFALDVAKAYKATPWGLARQWLRWMFRGPARAPAAAPPA